MAVLGDRESILIFKAFGVDVFAIEEKDTFGNQKLINRLAKEGYAIILITEQAALHLQDALEHYKKQVTPSILLIPSGEGSLGLAEKRMKQHVERAVGVDIVQSET